MRLKCLPSQFAAFLILAHPRTKNEEKTLQKRKKAAYFYTTLHNSTKSYIGSPAQNRTGISSSGDLRTIHCTTGPVLARSQEFGVGSQ